jgi:putative SOS response-associated peptidase YedK
MHTCMYVASCGVSTDLAHKAPTMLMLADAFILGHGAVTMCGFRTWFQEKPAHARCDRWWARRGGGELLVAVGLMRCCAAR